MRAVERQCTIAAVALVGVQVLHAFTPTTAAPENAFGYVTGYLALLASVVALTGLIRGRSWARPLLGIVGAVIAVGFLLLHFVPIHIFLTDPYVGVVGIGVIQWAVVYGAMTIGSWCAFVAFRPSRREPVQPLQPTEP